MNYYKQSTIGNYFIFTLLTSSFVDTSNYNITILHLPLCLNWKFLMYIELNIEINENHNIMFGRFVNFNNFGYLCNFTEYKIFIIKFNAKTCRTYVYLLEIKRLKDILLSLIFWNCFFSSLLYLLFPLYIINL